MKTFNFIVKYRNFSCSIGIDERIEESVLSSSRKEAVEEIKNCFFDEGHDVQGIWAKYGKKNLL